MSLGIDGIREKAWWLEEGGRRGDRRSISKWRDISKVMNNGQRRLPEGVCCKFIGLCCVNTEPSLIHRSAVETR